MGAVLELFGQRPPLCGQTLATGKGTNMASHFDRVAKKAAQHRRNADRFARLSSRQFTLARQLIRWESDDAVHLLSARCLGQSPHHLERGDDAVMRALGLANIAEKHQRRAERCDKERRRGISDSLHSAKQAHERLQSLHRLNRAIGSESQGDWVQANLDAHSIHKLHRRTELGYVDGRVVRDLRSRIRAGQGAVLLPASPLSVEPPKATDSFRVEHDLDRRLVAFVFRRKPAPHVRSLLAVHGFQWSSVHTAFVQPLSDRVRKLAGLIVDSHCRGGLSLCQTGYAIGPLDNICEVA